MGSMPVQFVAGRVVACGRGPCGVACCSRLRPRGALVPGVESQDYSTRQGRTIVTSRSGGSEDMPARIVAGRLLVIRP